jgi:hypothetical protein
MALEASQVKAHVNSLVGALSPAGIYMHAIIISKTSESFTFEINDTGVCAPASLGSGNFLTMRIYQAIATSCKWCHPRMRALQQIINTYDDWKVQLRSHASKMILVC